VDQHQRPGGGGDAEDQAGLRNRAARADESQRFAAATTLANRRDPAAVEELLAVIASSQTARGWRAFACLALANYPGDPRVEPAIKTVLSDGEWGDRAKQALEQLHAAQKK
jgi:hypothetical protein